ncbi:hypothetical protein [Paenibacillus typhae]|uniref:Uncharacterized protein n=1 Tax=Paenibacillus typhae TaxID=1174501 RepID=A0A1G8FSD8_9BACL|nr:hypothetical protein [Paenibacillus typhae]SDH85072.1 hypothetical protein SAMN05216192_101333 [Paenibacillus typhae]
MNPGTSVSLNGVEVQAICNVQEVQGTDQLETDRVILELEKKTEERFIERMKDAVSQINKRALLQVKLPSPLLLVIMIYKPFNTIVGSWFQ